MSNNTLSQEEIDRLLNGNASGEKTGGSINQDQADIIGEVGNISMSQAATTLSSILNHKVLITTPEVSCLTFGQVIAESETPKVVTNIEFKQGLYGSNMLMLDVNDAIIIASLMMGEGTDVEGKEFTELELSAVGEAMNQMMGSASTAMATMLNKTIDILPPIIEVWDSEENVNYDHIQKDTVICKISFNLNVEGVLNSEIMQIFTLETVREVADLMMADKAEVVSGRQTPAPEVEERPAAKAPEPTERIAVQKPEFQELTSTGTFGSPRNLDLIMDVPLEFSVVLGESQKTIRDILALGSGSVVELDKMTDEPLEIYVNGKLIAEGEVVVINESFGIRITNILSKEQRIKHLR